ncbi:PREDICTED: BURP, partial [Prunus dulcis]
MGFHLPLIFAILSLAVVALANHAAQPAPQLYWNSVLPNTQMPRSISELLHPDSTNEENIVNAVGNGKGKPEIFPLRNRNYVQSHYGVLNRNYVQSHYKK